MTQPLSVIIVEKNGSLKSLLIKDFKTDDLYKKCGFKKKEDFLKQVEWNIKLNGKKYFVEVFAKTDGRPNSENKYDFPPPIDTKLFFGNCVIVSHVKVHQPLVKAHHEKKYIDLTLELWNKMYEKLFGGFEDLAATAMEDENEEDELDNIPKERKTKDGYLKDGFVVDESEIEESASVSTDCSLDKEQNSNLVEQDCNIVIEDLTSELSEDSYDYDSE